MQNRKAYYRSIIRRREAWERRMAKDLRGYFTAEKKVITSHLKNGEDPYTAVALGVNDTAPVLAQLLEHYYTKAFRHFADDRYRNSAAMTPFEIVLMGYRARLQPILNDVAAKVVSIGAVTQRRLQAVIQQAYDDKETTGELQKRLIQGFNKELGVMSRVRALTIARTEIGTVASAGQLESFKQSGIEKKEWMAVIDLQTRDSHAETDGEIRLLDEAFSNGLTRPLQAGAPAREVINCRCCLAPVVE